jgi:pimeloyl-ACP methyl ester carboxylesterase
MPFFERDDARIYYELSGDGEPILLFAPGGMRSAIPVWANIPWNPIERLAGEFRVIAMDQRNAGQSTAAIGAEEGWDRYTEDHLGLLDHLGVDRCHLLGCCIGGSFIAALLKKAPERVLSAVLLQPIGATPENRPAFAELFDGWVAETKPAHPDVPDAHWASYKERMFGGEFVYCATPEEVQGMTTPMLVLMGDDQYHPQSTSRQIAQLAANAELVEHWKEPDAVESGFRRVREFLHKHPAA